MGENLKDKINSLNYTFQLYLININNKMLALKRQDKYHITLWKNKLQESGTSLEECELRNEFALHMSQQIDSGNLGEPFNQRPPTECLLELKEMINVPLPSGKKLEDIKKTKTKKQTRTELSDKEFIVGPNPVAKCGAFCYLAVLARTEEGDD